MTLILLCSFVWATSNDSPQQHSHPHRHHISHSNHSLIKSNNEYFQRDANNSLAMCVIIKDERIEDVTEWVEYYFRMGASTIYILDNGSKNIMDQNVKRFAVWANTELGQSGAVEYLHYSGYQVAAYLHCLERFGQRHKYMGFLDLDEFVVVKDKSLTIVDVLDKYAQYGGLTLQWMMFGSSGHLKRPPGGALGNYHSCAPNYHVKTIVNTRHVSSVPLGNPHNFHYEEGFFAVNTDRQPVLSAFNPDPPGAVSDSMYEVMYINHYVVKSREDFEKKMERKSFESPGKTSNFFDETNDETVNECAVLKMPARGPHMDRSKFVVWWEADKGFVRGHLGHRSPPPMKYSRSTDKYFNGRTGSITLNDRTEH